MKKKAVIIIHGRSAKPAPQILLESCKKSIFEGLDFVDGQEDSYSKLEKKMNKNEFFIDIVYYADILGYKYEQDLYYKANFKDIMRYPWREKSIWEILLSTTGDVIELVIPVLKKAGIDFSKYLNDVDKYFNNPKYKQEIFRRIDDKINQYKHIDEIFIVGHSLGSIVSYQYLKESIVNAGKDFSKFRLITMGSPLGLETVKSKLLYPLDFSNNEISWINFSDPIDPVCCFEPELKGDFKSSIKDIKIANDYNLDKVDAKNSGIPNHLLYGYLRCPEFGDFIYSII